MQRSSWRKLFQDSSARTASPQLQTLFTVMQQRRPALAGFLTPMGLVEHQLGALAIDQEKDRILLDLISIFQREPDLREAAGLLLFQVMQPALADTYCRLKFLFGAEDDATGEICLAFYDRLAHIPLTGTVYVASALKKAVFRAVYENRQRRAKDQARITAVLVYAESVADLPPGSTEQHEISAQHAWRSLTAGGDYDPDDRELDPLRQTLAREAALAPDDIELLILKGLCGRGWNEIGVSLGVQPSTARKRYQRLIGKLRSDPNFMP